MIYFGFRKNSKVKGEVVEYMEQLPVEFNVLESDDFLELSREIAVKVSKNPSEDRAILIDEDGIGPFMVATKVENIICAMLNDEQSALMTRDHNNANIITIGENIVGIDVIRGILDRFVTHKYAGGRHQVRVDMLNSMIGGK